MIQIMTKIIFPVLVFSAFVYSQDIDLKGRVVDENRNLLGGVKVELLRQGSTELTDRRGAFHFIKGKTAIFPEVINNLPDLPVIKGNSLLLNITSAKNVEINIVDMNGRLERTVYSGSLQPGNYNFLLQSSDIKPGVYIMKAKVGKKSFINKYLNSENTYDSGINQSAKILTLAKTAAVVDTLKISKEGYITKTMKLSAYKDSLSDIVLANTPDDPCAEITCESGYYCAEGECVENPGLTVIPIDNIKMFSYCGDDICTASEEENDNCCRDCGCGTGEYCSQDTVCKVGSTPIIIKPIPIVIYFPGDKLIHENGFTPSIWGNKVLFKSYDDGPSGSIYMYKLEDNSVTKLPTGNSSPDIYGGRMVFEDNSSVGEGYNIYYYSLTEGLSGFISPRNGYQSAPKIYNNAIVWQENDYLRMFWIPSGEETTIYHKTNHIQGPYGIWQAHVVYILGTSIGETYYLKTYNIGTRETETLLTTNEYLGDVDINSENIAYTHGTDQDNIDIFVYNLGTKLTTRITDTANNNHKLSLSVSGNRVAWIETVEKWTYSYYVYDLTSGQKTAIAENVSVGNVPSIDISGNNVVYMGNGNNLKLHQLK